MQHQDRLHQPVLALYSEPSCSKHVCKHRLVTSIPYVQQLARQGAVAHLHILPDSMQCPASAAAAPRPGSQSWLACLQVLCVNAAVSGLGSMEQISEACLDLQRSCKKQAGPGKVQHALSHIRGLGAGGGGGGAGWGAEALSPTSGCSRRCPTSGCIMLCPISGVEGCGGVGELTVLVLVRVQQALSHIRG